MARTPALLMLLLAVAACGSGEAATGGQGTDVIPGRGVLSDDTGLPDRPDGGGWMLVLPAARTEHLWAEAGEEPDDPRHARFPIQDDRVQAIGGRLVEVNDDGTYSVGSTGGVLLCRVREAGWVSGCDHVDLSQADTVLTGFGEGGFAAWVEGDR